MNLCNFAKVIISRCTKDASTIHWWNDNACSSDDLKLDIPAHSQLITTQTRHALYHKFMEKYPKMQISFEKFKYTLPRIQKYITNSKYWKNNNKNGEKMEFIRLHSLHSWFKLPENDKKQHQIEDCDTCQSIISNAILHKDLLQKAQQSYMKCAPVILKSCEVHTHQPARTPTKELSRY